MQVSLALDVTSVLFYENSLACVDFTKLQLQQFLGVESLVRLKFIVLRFGCEASVVPPDVVDGCGMISGAVLCAHIGLPMGSSLRRFLFLRGRCFVFHIFDDFGVFSLLGFSWEFFEV